MTLKIIDYIILKGYITRVYNKSTDKNSCICVIYYRPLRGEFAGKASIWGTLSPAVQQVALNVDSEFQKLFISNTKETTNLIPPTF